MPEPIAQASERAPWLRPRRSTRIGLRMMRDAGPVMAPVLFGVAAVEGLLPTAFTVVSGRLVSVAETAGDEPGRLVVPLAVVAVVFLAGEVIQHFRFAVAEGFSYRVEGRRMERAMAAALTPPGVGHLEDPQVLDVVRLAARTEWPNTGAFAVGVIGMTMSRVAALSSGVVVASFRWWLAAVLLILWWWAGRVMRKGQADAWEDTSGRLRWAEYVRWLGFAPGAAKEVRIFAFGGWLLETFSGAWYGVMTDVWRRRRGTRARQAMVLAVVLPLQAAAFYVVAAAARSGELRAAQLVVIAPAMLAMSRFGQTDEFTISVALGAVALPSVDHAEALLGSERFALPGTRSAATMPRQSIRFENVSFAYASRRDDPVFNGLDLEVAAGRSLAIVGANGAGKTTLIKLLARLYEPSAGRITVDGVDLRELEPHGWQRQVAAIFQDFIRYEFTAADNVGFGGVDHLGDLDRLRSAAERVGALSLVEALPEAWDTTLSRRYVGGTEISGGQWQRVALARALFAVESGASVLVLDEPTANLDVRAEVELFDRFLDVTRGATTILISHRFSTVRRADRIVVLERGRVVEDGTHDELLARDGRYAHSFRLQAERYVEDTPAIGQDAEESVGATDG